MTKKKKSALPNIEVLIVLVLVISFILMAIGRCNKTKKSFQEEEQTERRRATESEASIATTTPTPSTASPNTTTSMTGAIAAAPKNTTPVTTETVTVVSRLYVTLDDLNVRTGPHLDSTIITKLKLFDEVSFMNEITDFKQRISLGPEIAEEPWVKIRSRKGHIGWVYGAGVNYYKKKRLQTPIATEAPRGNQ